MPTPAHLSPLLLAQEFVRKQPWRLLAVCILLNRTNGMKQVKPMLADFFDNWPNPHALLNAPEDEVKSFLKPLGFQNVRYERLAGMSIGWLAGKRPPDDRLYGIGTYGKQSYEIFVQGYLITEPQDKELKRYVKWAQEEYAARNNFHHNGLGGVQQGVQASQRDAHR